MRNAISAASLGIVLSGGGTRSAYAVGALRALAEVHGITEPGFMCSMSGGTAPALFYLARRYDDMYEWGWRFDDPRFISWKRLLNGPIMDVEFLIEGILAKQAPDLQREVSATTTNYFIAATRLPEGTLHWFTRESSARLFEQIKATKTASGVSQCWVKIDGVRYADGCLSATVSDAVAKLYNEGAERIFVIDNSTYGRISWITRSLMRFGVRNAPKSIKTIVERNCERITEPLTPDTRLTICRREKLPTRHGLVRSAHRLQKTIHFGYIDMAKLRLS